MNATEIVRRLRSSALEDLRPAADAAADYIEELEQHLYALAFHPDNEALAAAQKLVAHVILGDK